MGCGLQRRDGPSYADRLYLLQLLFKGTTAKQFIRLAYLTGNEKGSPRDPNGHPAIAYRMAVFDRPILFNFLRKLHSKAADKYAYRPPQEVLVTPVSWLR